MLRSVAGSRRTKPPAKVISLIFHWYQQNLSKLCRQYAQDEGNESVTCLVRWIAHNHLKVRNFFEISSLKGTKQSALLKLCDNYQMRLRLIEKKTSGSLRNTKLHKRSISGEISPKFLKLSAELADMKSSNNGKPFRKNNSVRNKARASIAKLNAGEFVEGMKPVIPK